MNSWKFIARNKYDDCRQFLLDYKEGDENFQALARVAYLPLGLHIMCAIAQAQT